MNQQIPQHQLTQQQLTQQQMSQPQMPINTQANMGTQLQAPIGTQPQAQHSSIQNNQVAQPLHSHVSPVNQQPNIQPLNPYTTAPANQKLNTQPLNPESSVNQQTGIRSFAKVSS